MRPAPWLADPGKLHKTQRARSVGPGSIRALACLRSPGPPPGLPCAAAAGVRVNGGRDTWCGRNEPQLGCTRPGPRYANACGWRARPGRSVSRGCAATGPCANSTCPSCAPALQSALPAGGRAVACRPALGPECGWRVWGSVLVDVQYVLALGAELVFELKSTDDLDDYAGRILPPHARVDGLAVHTARAGACQGSPRRVLRVPTRPRSRCARPASFPRDRWSWSARSTPPAGRRRRERTTWPCRCRRALMAVAAGSRCGCAASRPTPSRAPAISVGCLHRARIDSDGWSRTPLAGVAYTELSTDCDDGMGRAGRLETRRVPPLQCLVKLRAMRKTRPTTNSLPLQHRARV